MSVERAVDDGAKQAGPAYGAKFAVVGLKRQIGQIKS